MNIILDTHIFLWHITDDVKLKAKYKDIITDEANNIYLSAASIWECIIKEQIKKLIFPAPASEYLTSKRVIHEISSLPIDEESLSFLSTLPDLHRDPFDRIILCQALKNGCNIITEDQILKKYPYQVFL